MFKKELTNMNMLFSVIHTSGVIIYSYPYLNEEHILVSSLVAAINALVTNIVDDADHEMTMKFGDYHATCKVYDDVIYCFFSDKTFYRSSTVLDDLIEIVKQNFPAIINNDIVRVNDEKVKALDAAIDLYLTTITDYVKDVSLGNFQALYKIWLLSKSPNIHIIKKVYEAIINGKTIFLFHEDMGFAYEFASLIVDSLPIKKLPIRIISSKSIQEADLTQQAIYIARKRPRGRVSKIVETHAALINLER